MNAVINEFWIELVPYIFLVRELFCFLSSTINSVPEPAGSTVELNFTLVCWYSFLYDGGKRWIYNWKETVMQVSI